MCDQFSVPIAADDETGATAERRRSRGRGSLGRGEDSDFVMEHDDDSDFLDDEDDDTMYSKKKKGNGKRKGKAKAKSSSYTARSTVAPGENPAVMLISLKAVCACPYDLFPGRCLIADRELLD